MNVYLKSAKIFLLASGDEGIGERRFSAGPSVSQPILAPDWIKETNTFIYGVKDGTIIDLTPPGAPEVTDEEVASSTPAPVPSMGSGNIIASTKPRK